MLLFHCKHDENRESERKRKRQKKKQTEIETEKKTERDRKGEKRKASIEIRNDAEVEHTSFFVADRVGISGA